MRFNLEKPVKECDYGKTRTISKFLWFPRTINYEVRWLERVLIEQKVDKELVIDVDCRMNYWYNYFWRDVRWVDTPANLR